MSIVSCYKIILVGDPSVGKTNIFLRLMSNDYRDNNKSTVGIDFGEITKEISNEKIKIHLWDTAGQERFHTIKLPYYRGSHAIIFVFDITNRDSFHNLQYWINEITSNRDKNLVGIIVGNKNDLSNRAVTIEEAIIFSQKYYLKYLETSARGNIGIMDILENVIQNIKENEKIVQEPQDTLKIVAPPKKFSCLHRCNI